ncbi:MAG: branched-chain amino acid ABC transporter permease [Natronomonas sp.]
MVVGDVASFLVTGAMISALYALVAIGFTMIFGVGGVLNLSHGALTMVAAYAFLSATDFLPDASYALWLALLVGIAAGAVIAYALYLAIVRYIEEDVVITFLVTLLFALFLQEVIVAQFSANPGNLPTLVSGTINLAEFGVDTRVRYMEITGFLISWIAIGLLWYYVTNTDSGRSILATSMSEKGAKLTGVDLPRVKAQTWLIGGGLAGIAGVFLGNLQQTSPYMWVDPLGLAFIIVVIGGVGSIKGSIIAAYLIGYLETATVMALGFEYRGILSLVLVLVIIMIRPEGLFGREYIE